MISSRHEPCHLDAIGFANFHKPQPGSARYLEIIGMAMAWDHRVSNNAISGIMANLHNTHYGGATRSRTLRVRR